MKHTLTEIDDAPSPKRQRVNNIREPTGASAAKDEDESLVERATDSPGGDFLLPTASQERGKSSGHKLPPLLRITKETRLHIYEYLLPRAGLIPSARQVTSVDRMLRCRNFNEQDPVILSIDDDGLDPSLSELRTTYAQGSWPALFRVNRTLYDEALDLMYKRLIFEVNIDGRPYKQTSWDWHGMGSIQIHCKQILQPCYLGSLLKNLRKVSLRLWLVRKNGPPAVKDSDKPSIGGNAKAVKAHINNFVMTLQEALSLKSLEVELEITRREYYPWNNKPLDPPVLEDTEIENTVHWYLQPFRHLRNIEINFRYLGAPSSVVQGYLNSIKNEVMSDVPVTLIRPLCVLYARFCLERALHHLHIYEHPRAKLDNVNLPSLIERLWIAQDTGDLETFRQMQLEIFRIWKETRERFEATYAESLKMGNDWAAWPDKEPMDNLDMGTSQP